MATVLLSLAAAPMIAQQRDPVRLDLASGVTLSVGGTLRERYESWTGFNFSIPAAADHADGFLLTRALVHGRLSLGTHGALYIQGKSSQATRRTLQGGQRTSEVDELDLQQAWAEWRLGGSARSLLVRVGRQDLLLGRQRLVSPSDWSNTRRTFEGAQGLLSGPRRSLRVLVARPVRVKLYQANEGDTLQWIAGAYLTAERGARAAADLYYFRTVNDAAAFNGTTGREVRSTVGARVSTRGTGRWDLDVEGAAQFGTLGGHDVRAWMLAAQLGLNVPALPGAPRFYLGYDAGSGDDATGGDVGTFNQLYPTGHTYYGFADVNGRQNLVDISGGVSAKVVNRVTVLADVHRFLRQNNRDALYGKSGSVVRAAGTALPNSVGTELDLTAVWPVHARVQAQAGYSYYVAGAFLKASPSATDLTFGYGMVTLTW